MNTELINPFLESLLNVLSTMATIKAQTGHPSLKKNEKAFGDIT